MISLFTEKIRDSLVSKRNGEKKIGEEIDFIQSLDDLKERDAKFVLLGIKEDIGIRANFGTGGATAAWDLALKAFLNIQSNHFFNGKEFLVLGCLEFEDLISKCSHLNPQIPEDLEQLRRSTMEIDHVVKSTIQKIKELGKTPIIIGGGHNNSYGAIAGCSLATKHSIPVLNIDPHADFRDLEGRHSGNGFSYARNEGHLGKYAVFGLHESYNSASVLQLFKNDPNLWYQSFESLLWRESKELDSLFKNSLNWLSGDKIGLELDLDSITNFPVSALNPSGFDLNTIRHFIRSTASLKDCHYFHICEGSPGRSTSQQQNDLLAKSFAYLISDFIKCSNDH